MGTTLNALGKLHRKRKKLSVVVGAGVSMSASLPGWDAFNTELLRRCLNFVDASADITLDEGYRMASEYMRRFGRDAVPDLVRQRIDRHCGDKTLGKTAYEELLGDALYSSAPTILEPSQAHLEIAALESTYIYTFNYDTLLQQALRKLGKESRTWTSGTAPTQGSGVIVQHLHGALERGSAPEGSLVLSEQDYFRTTGRWGHKGLHGILTEKNRAQHVLLVGLSMADPRLRNVLLQRLALPKKDRPPVTVLLKSHSEGGDTLDRLTSRQIRTDEENYWETWDVDVLFMDRHENLPYYLRCIRLGANGSKWANKKGHSVDRTNSKGSWDVIAREVYCYIRKRFSVSAEERVGLGGFVPTNGELLWVADWRSPLPGMTGTEEPERSALGLDDVGPSRVERTLSVENLWTCQGVSGYAYLSGVPMVATPTSTYLNRNFSNEKTCKWLEGQTFRSLYAVPVFDEQHRPAGVVHVTSNRDDPFWHKFSKSSPVDGSLKDELSDLLSTAWKALIQDSRKR